MLKWNMKVESELFPTEILKGEPQDTIFNAWNN